MATHLRSADHTPAPHSRPAWRSGQTYGHVQLVFLASDTSMAGGGTGSRGRRSTYPASFRARAVPLLQQRGWPFSAASTQVTATTVNRRHSTTPPEPSPAHRLPKRAQSDAHVNLFGPLMENGTILPKHSVRSVESFHRTADAPNHQPNTPNTKARTRWLGTVLKGVQNTAGVVGSALTGGLEKAQGVVHAGYRAAAAVPASPRISKFGISSVLPDDRDMRHNRRSSIKTSRYDVTVASSVLQRMTEELRLKISDAPEEVSNVTSFKVAKIFAEDKHFPCNLATVRAILFRAGVVDDDLDRALQVVFTTATTRAQVLAAAVEVLQACCEHVVLLAVQENLKPQPTPETMLSLFGVGLARSSRLIAIFISQYDLSDLLNAHVVTDAIETLKLSLIHLYNTVTLRKLTPPASSDKTTHD